MDDRKDDEYSSSMAREIDLVCLGFKVEVQVACPCAIPHVCDSDSFIHASFVLILGAKYIRLR